MFYLLTWYNLLISVIIPIIALFFMIGGTDVIREIIKRKARQLRFAKTMFPIVKSMVFILLKTLYLSFIQYMNTSIVKIDNDTYVLSYVIEGILYRTIITPSKLGHPVLLVSDNASNDVSDIVLPYLGPSYNWHGLALTPASLGFDRLIFEMSDGNELVFEKKEPLKF